MAGKKDRIERINSQAVPLPEAFIDWMDRRMPRYIIYEPGKTEGKCTGCEAVSQYEKTAYQWEIHMPGVSQESDS